MDFFLQGTEDTPTELFVLGTVTEDVFPLPGDVSPASVQRMLEQTPGEKFVIHLNSYGGTTSAAIAIYNILKGSGKTVITINEGFACSAASLIFAAGSKRIMRNNSLLMIHNAWTATTGNSDELRNTADSLDTISAAAAQIYEDNCKLPRKEIDAMLKHETWIPAETALSTGMATQILQAGCTENAGCSSALDAIRRVVMQRRPPAQALRKHQLFDEIFGGFA